MGRRGFACMRSRVGVFAYVPVVGHWLRVGGVRLCHGLGGVRLCFGSVGVVRVGVEVGWCQGARGGGCVSVR